MAAFTLFGTSLAPPEVVFDTLTDHCAYPTFTPLRRAELERTGDPAPNGVGAIRVLRAVGPPLREEVLVYERPTRFSYRLLSGAPMRDHVGTVELTPLGRGTAIAYSLTTTPAVPLAGFAVVAVVKLGIRQLLSGVVRESERRASLAQPSPV